jgi:glycosyltransferase involved in cell wall biosynthesis
VQRSLSVLLPVKNAQYTLAPTVHKILDVVSEISEKVELLIIDDGSADATSEVAADLMRDYPQVRAICQGRSIGKEEAVRSALQKATGDIELIHEQQQGASLNEIVKTLKASTVRGRFYFRLDAPVSAAGQLPIDHALFAAENGLSPRRSPVSSRPARPNFLERLKTIVLGE